MTVTIADVFRVINLKDILSVLLKSDSMKQLLGLYLYISDVLRGEENVLAQHFG